MNPHADHLHALFPELMSGDAAARAVLEGAQQVSLPAAEWVFRAGSACANYLLVVEGSVRVQVIGENGREAVLYRVLPGQSCVLTTCCILAGDAYPAEACSESPVRALVIGKPAFDKAMHVSPAFRQFVFANLGGRIAEVISRMDEILFWPVERRLAAFLLAQRDAAGTLALTHQDIAVELGTAREVISRHLKRFESSGLVELGRSSLKILQADALRRIADTAV